MTALALPALPRRVLLTLPELVRAARLAGDVPLPLRLDGAPDGLADRLGGAVHAHHLVRRALALADGPSPGTGIEPEVAVALRVLAAGSLRLRLDLVVGRGGGAVPLCSWFSVADGLVAQLSTSDGRQHELAWFDPSRWVSELARAVTVAGVGQGESGVPGSLTMPSEVLVSGAAAVRAGRPDLLTALAPDEAGVVTALETGCRGRLRVLVHRGGRLAVSSWLLLDDGWRELRPGPGATVRLRRRDPRVLGPWLAPLVARAAGAGR